ncbi:adenylate/guanylate cyclase domain-containing protein [Tunicatimonas pelagia]|uniref:adenylate/guanylate cyclase domain-containing protein n=1 Tax=Tunicatimonas pelagia TaxID=931531 RepID=UPI0026659104|nr:adenylate/guanylate cyclase domain-containing protein [Tunicatimonas pelagia]WKN45638.1 adenylate/guanylate cyclase domain-containing protein [Tunicatimonas pelagia]
MLYLLKKYPKQTDTALLILGFVIGMNFLAYVKYAGVDWQYFYQLHPSFLLITPTLEGLVLGTTLAVMEHVLFKRFYVRFSYSQALLMHIIITAIVIVITLLVGEIFNQIVFNKQDWGIALPTAWQFIQSPLNASLFAYSLALATLLNFFRQLGNHFGHSIILDFITGKYVRPQEEHRTFMFLDLNQSTTIAEQLGHVKYSRLLNQCFNDLSEFILRYEADVYQYVGDEVVLTWHTDQTKEPIDIAGLYFDFRSKLRQNAVSYREKFGVAPQFKASVHTGLVSITRVGHHRKTLAYHGDVLNTAARLINICSRLKKDLLVTATSASFIQRSPQYRVDNVDTLLLRGKHNTTQVFEVIQLLEPWSAQLQGNAPLSNAAL